MEMFGLTQKLKKEYTNKFKAMFGNNKDDDERFWNFTMFNFYGTDKEFEEFAPIMGVVIVLIAIGGLIWWLCS